MDPDLINKAITNRTKAIIAVHLYGQPAQIDEIKKLADSHNLILIEDCAQAHLSQFLGRPVGTIGHCGCFSFYPGKNLGAYGEGGAVITDDEELYQKIMMIRDHGSAEKYTHQMIGHNYRMEGLQGAVLTVKLNSLEDWTATRRKNAGLYTQQLKECKQVTSPQEMPDARHVYHLYVIRTPDRDALQKHLLDRGIGTGIHYPIPCHLQNPYRALGYKEQDFPLTEKYAGEILSLPMSEQLHEDEITYVCSQIKEYYGG
jgi:dTDP-4-amino-4,6-dideoxygalactose transaminase